MTNRSATFQPRNPRSALLAFVVALMLGSGVSAARRPAHQLSQSQANQAPTPPPGQLPAAGPVLRIESFGTVQPFAVGTAPIEVVATIRNVGRDPLPADVAMANVLGLAGLDYVEGDTRPKLPALAPLAAVSFRWKLQPTDADASLVAGVDVQMPGVMPEAKVLPIQHFSELSLAEPAAVSKLPVARASEDMGSVENATVRARIVVSPADVPVLLVSVHTPTGWRRAGVSLPLAEVLSGEGGQHPWWEVFKTDDIRAENGKREASLVLSGAFGLRWRATVTLTLRMDSSVVDARLMLSPRRTMKLSGLRLTPYMTGGESFGANTTEAEATAADGAAILGAVRWGIVTTGAVWADAPPRPGWSTVPTPNVAGADYRLIATDMHTDGAPDIVRPTDIVVVKSRLFAFCPSATVADAHRVQPAR